MRSATDEAVTWAACLGFATEALQHTSTCSSAIAGALAITVESRLASSCPALARAPHAQAGVRIFTVAAVAKSGLVRVRPANVARQTVDELGPYKSQPAVWADSDPAARPNAAAVLEDAVRAVEVWRPGDLPVPHKDFSNLHEKMSGKRASASESHAFTSTQGEPSELAVLCGSCEKVMLLPSNEPNGPMTSNSFA